VTLHAGGHRIRRAVLYQRGRGLIAEAQETAPAAAPPPLATRPAAPAGPASSAVPTAGPRIVVPAAPQPDEAEEPRIKRIPLRRRDP
jgi:hypothetical protein